MLAGVLLLITNAAEIGNRLEKKRGAPVRRDFEMNWNLV